MWIKKYVKMRIILFKNWKLLLKITYQTAPWSLSLFLRLGIQLCFPTSMPVLLFTTSQICYHQCEAKMKRSQISVRKRISELLCVKSTSFFFFLFNLISNFYSKPGIYPGMAETGPIRPVFKSIRNTTVFILVYTPVRNIPAIQAGTVQNLLPWL